MSIDTLAQIATAVATSVLVPSVIWLVKAILRLNETMTRLETKISDGVEPRLAQCEGDIETLYDRTNEHGKALAALKATHPGLS
jgi:hypothetical protein